jgi:hypothetical protein
MTTIKHPVKQPNSKSVAKPSSPAPTMGETTLNGLPMLTEVVAKTESHRSRVLNAEEMQQLQHKLEAHIEALFTSKLAQHLEQLQRQAIDQALGELKAELPELLRNTLNAYLDSR